VWLPLEHAVPIHEPVVWDALTATRGHEHNSTTWTGHFRGSLNRIPDEDGRFLETLLHRQKEEPRVYELNSSEQRLLTTHMVRRVEGSVAVTVPEDSIDDLRDGQTEPTPRESIRVQALLGRIGATMGHRIWIPASDRSAVLREWSEGNAHVINQLPLNYDETTLGTIERIDVLWLRGRSIVRAFEVEHTTAIYSGILRMADLLALQPNMDIRLHIVAPEVRKEKVFEEIRRPVFAFLERGPLAACCTFISYDSVRELARQTHLQHLQDSVLEEYAEEAE